MRLLSDFSVTGDFGGFVSESSSPLRQLLSLSPLERQMAGALREHDCAKRAARDGTGRAERAAIFPPDFQPIAGLKVAVQVSYVHT